MKSLIRTLLWITLLGVSPTWAAVWPDTVVPCNGTLQACINATAAGGSVQLRTSTTINEELVINKNFYLFADPGYRPVLASSRSISANAVGSGSFFFTVQGIDLGRGRLRINASAASSVNINIERVNVADAVFANAIEITGGSGALTLNLRNCKLRVPDNIAEPDPSAIIIAAIGSSATLNIFHNDITIDSTVQGAGIKLLSSGQTMFNALGNRIRGRAFMAGITAIQTGVGSIMNANLVSNVVSGQGGGTLAPGGLSVKIDAGVGRALVINNTIVHGDKGIVLSAAGDFQTSTLTNNLVAWHDQGVMIAAVHQTDVAVNNNLFYANATNEYIDGTGNIAADPRLTSTLNLRPAADSPALDAGDSSPVFAPLSPLPRVDADGLPRSRGSLIDIGAYERHATHVLFRSVAGSGNLAGPGIPTNAFVPFILSQNWNPNGVGGVYNAHAIGLTYGSTWSLFNQDFSPLPANSAFNVFLPRTNRLPYQDTSSDTSNSASPFASLPTILSEDANLFWLFTLNRMMTTTVGTLNPHPVALLYFTRWGLYNADGADFPEDASYSLYYQDRSPNAYVHTVGPGNRSGHISRLDHPLLNGNPCAQIQIAASTEGGVMNPHELGVYYSGAYWTVFNQDFATLADDVTVNVLVDPAQAEFCNRLFWDGFD